MWLIYYFQVLGELFTHPMEREAALSIVSGVCLHAECSFVLKNKIISPYNKTGILCYFVDETK